MRDSITQPPCRPVRLRGSLLRALALTLALGAVAACGGGGGGGTPGPAAIDGLSGDVLMPAFDLGRIIEQEPNDSSAQPFRLPPMWPRCTLEVTGELGTTAARFGRADPTDVFLFTAVRGQVLDLELHFQDVDPVDSGPNDFTVEVVRRATGVRVAQSGPGQPRTLDFDAAAGEAYEILVTALAGHGWYVMRLTGSDLPVGPPMPKPSFLQAPAVTPVASPTEPAARTCAHTHVIVRFEDATDPQAFCEREGLRLGRRTASGSYRVHLPAGEEGEDRAAALCERLQDLPGVRWVEPDWVVQPLADAGDPEFNRQWTMRAIGATSAWDITRGDPSIVVAIVDAGLVAHPDLVGRTVPGHDFVSPVANAGDGNGRDADPTDPGDQEASSGTSLWHGTHVASLIAGGTGDAYGGTGVAPNCLVMMLRALGIGGGLVSDAADAILFAAGLLTTADGRTLPAPARVINLSIGLAQDSLELRDACDRAANRGCFLVAAVGNNGGALQYPARYASTFAVAAVDGKLLTTSYSSFGAAVDIAAPGGGGADQWNDGWPDGVLAATKDETVTPNPWGHRYLVGTSQAAPHVAGAAALLLSLDPTLSRQDLATILKATALDLGQPGEDVAYGSGLLQVHEAVKIVMNRLGNPRDDEPRLMLPTNSVQFEGLRTLIDIPLMNAGGGTANVFFVRGETDDGADWLAGELFESDHPRPPVNMESVRITVNRNLLPQPTGRFSGSLLLGNSQGTLQSIRVVVYAGERTRAGQILPVVAIESDTGIARRRGSAYPEFGYRYWLRGLPEAMFHLRAGEDLDADGFFCEPSDACGWHGGPLESDAIPVEHVPDEPAVQGLSIELAPPP